MIEIIMIGAIVAAASLITLWILGHVKESKTTNIIAHHITFSEVVLFQDCLVVYH